MTDETKQAASGGVVETAVDGVETAVKSTVDETVKAVDGVENTVASGAANDEDKVESYVDEREEALKKFIETSAPVELLKAIEEQAKVLLKLIHGIPDGVTHAWHSLAAEISARKL